MDSCDRMDHIISKMCKLTRYETKEYVDGIKILDFEHSSHNEITAVLNASGLFPPLMRAI